MNYKFYIPKKNSRRFLKLQLDHSVGLISQQDLLLDRGRYIPTYTLYTRGMLLLFCTPMKFSNITVRNSADIRIKSLALHRHDSVN